MKNSIRFQEPRIHIREGRQVIATYAEGRKGHYLLYPEKITARQFSLVSNALDIDFRGGTKGIADITLIYEGNL